MSLEPARVQRFARQILLGDIGGERQERILASTLLLHGEAPLCARYLAAGGLGRLLVTGELPELAGHDPAFEMERAAVGAPADFVLDLGDGEAFRAARGPALWGGAPGERIVLGGDLRTDLPGTPGAPAARALLESLAAGEAMRALMGHEPHAYDFSLEV